MNEHFHGPYGLLYKAMQEKVDETAMDIFGLARPVYSSLFNDDIIAGRGARYKTDIASDMQHRLQVWRHRMENDIV